MKFILFCIPLMLFSASSFAQEQFIKILSPKEIKATIGPYPTLGSEASARDFEILKNFQSTRTKVQCEVAKKEETPTLITFFAGINGPLSKKEADEIHASLLKVYAEAGVNIYLAKRLYKRPRPYEVDSEIVPCLSLEESYAYPSGHATMARIFARVLSRVFPERQNAFLMRADEVARNRVLGGVHHPSDIEAAKKLGDLLASTINNSEMDILFK